MAFGEKSSNARERRAFAHAKLARLKTATYHSEALVEAFRAVVAASHTSKGRASGFAGRLAKEAVVVGDLEGDQPEAARLWGPRTTWSSTTVRLDGYYTDGTNQEVLDIAGTGDTGCVSPEQASEAQRKWEQGRVLQTNADWEEDRPALVIPQRTVSNPIISEALSRHFQADVTSPALIQ